MKIHKLKEWINQLPEEQLNYELIVMKMETEGEYLVDDIVIGLNEDQDEDGSFIFIIDEDNKRQYE
jgi:hypothetical protein